MANVLKTYRELKKKHPDALLLFRCGDFYEVYGDDAKVCAKVLGITLTWCTPGKRHVPGDYSDAMVGFPYHALDSYLPKIIRAGHRVAICDQLEDPKLTKKLVRRGSDELTTTATNNRINNPQTTENMILNINNQNNETKNESANTVKLQGSEYTVKDNNGKDVKFESVVPAAICEPIQDADFEEVTDNVPQKAQKAAPKKQPISEAQPAQPVSEAKPSPSTGERGEGLPQVQFSTYKTKKGDTAPQIIGFGGEDDPRWKAHKDAGHKYVSASYRRDISGEKVYILLFGTKYMDVAKALAGAYNTADVNAWHRAEDACMAIYEQAQRDGKARWEEKKAQWAAARSEKLKVKSEELAAAESAEKQVAAMLEKLMKGEDVPESILKHIDPEVLAKFTKAA